MRFRVETPEGEFVIEGADEESVARLIEDNRPPEMADLEPIEPEKELEPPKPDPSEVIIEAMSGHADAVSRHAASIVAAIVGQKDAFAKALGAPEERVVGLVAEMTSQHRETLAALKKLNSETREMRADVKAAIEALHATMAADLTIERDDRGRVTGAKRVTG